MKNPPVGPDQGLETLDMVIAIDAATRERGPGAGGPSQRGAERFASPGTLPLYTESAILARVPA